MGVRKSQEIVDVSEVEMRWHELCVVTVEEVVGFRKGFNGVEWVLNTQHRILNVARHYVNESLSVHRPSVIFVGRILSALDTGALIWSSKNRTADCALMKKCKRFRYTTSSIA